MVNKSILVVIVSYNAMKWVDRCLGSLRLSTVPCDIIIIDNGSVDGTQKYIRDKYKEVELIESRSNLGFGRANNIGLQKALDEEYDFVYLLNQDAWVMPDTFEKLVEISKAHPEFGILSPFQMNADMKHIDRNFITNVLNWSSSPQITNDLYNQQLKEVYSVPTVMAAHWFIKRECLLQVGGFSPSFPHYGEDNNYADRTLFWNLKIGIVPSLRVVHDRGGRQETVSQKINSLYIDSIRRISDPKRNNVKSFLEVLIILIQSALYYRSLRPIHHMMKLFMNSWSIIRNKKYSMSKTTAFLKEL